MVLILGVRVGTSILCWPGGLGLRVTGPRRPEPLGRVAAEISPGAKWLEVLGLPRICEQLGSPVA